MRSEVKKSCKLKEFWFEEGCFITETANDEGDALVSIARARVEPGSTTAWHMLDGITERYVIVAGRGLVEVGALHEEVEPGDVVRIPENTRQRITNTGSEDLIFYVVCAPPFASKCYISLEEDVE